MENDRNVLHKLAWFITQSESHDTHVTFDRDDFFIKHLGVFSHDNLEELREKEKWWEIFSSFNWVNFKLRFLLCFVIDCIWWRGMRSEIVDGFYYFSISSGTKLSFFITSQVLLEIFFQSKLMRLFNFFFIWRGETLSIIKYSRAEYLLKTFYVM